MGDMTQSCSYFHLSIVYPLFHLSILLFHLSIFPLISLYHLSTFPPIHFLTYPLFHLSSLPTYPFFLISSFSPIYSFSLIHSSTYPLFQLSNYPLILPSTHSTIHLSTLSPIYSAKKWNTSVRYTHPSSAHDSHSPLFQLVDPSVHSFLYHTFTL